LAALAHGEALEVIETLLAGPAPGAPGSSSVELKHAERCLALDEALRAALSETSYVLETSKAPSG
jgi:hypothetical protein